MRHSLIALSFAQAVGFQQLAAQVRSQGNSNVAPRSGSPAGFHLDLEPRERRHDFGDFALEVKELGDPAATFTPGDLAVFPPPNASGVASRLDSVRVLLRSIADGRTWFVPVTRAPLAPWASHGQHTSTGPVFVVPQLPAGDYASWYVPGEKPDDALRLRITPGLQNLTTSGAVGWTIPTLAVVIGPGLVPARADAAVGQSPLQVEITLRANHSRIADLANDQPPVVQTSGSFARFRIAVKDAGTATFTVTAKEPGAAAPFATALLTVHGIKPPNGVNVWPAMQRYNGRIHFGRPDRPAVLLVHGVLSSGAHWLGPGADVGNADELDWDYLTTPAPKSMGDDNRYPGVGPEGFGLSDKLRLSNEDYWFNYLATRGFTVATWDQPGAGFDSAAASARVVLAQFLAETKSMTSPPPIALIGHSRGGLVIRRVLIDLASGKDHLDGDATRIRWVITLSTPHSGTVVGSLAADAESVLEDPQTYDAIGLHWPLDLAARDQIVKALQSYMEVLRGTEELAPNGPVLTFLRTRDRPLAGIRYYTFAGTVPTMLRLYRWDYDAQSAVPRGAPTSFRWTAVPTELSGISPFTDELPRHIREVLRLARRPIPDMPEFTHGQGDGAVSVASANLPWSSSFKAFPLNHEQVRWSRVVQDDVHVYLTKP